MISVIGRIVIVLSIAIAATIALLGFVMRGWLGLAIAVAVIALAVAFYLIDGALDRITARRAVRRMRKAADVDPSAPRVDAWLIVGRNNLLIADAAKRAILYHSRGMSWTAVRMDDFKRVDVVQRRGRFGHAITTLALSGELTGPPEIQMDVVDGDAEQFVTIARPRPAAAR